MHQQGSLQLIKDYRYLRYGLFALFLLVLNAIHSAQAADTDKAFCRYYARDLITLPQQAQHESPMCQRKQSHWNTDKQQHMQWCLSVSKEAANKKRYRHNKLVNLCDDTYKLLMVDRHRIANPLLSEKESVRLEPAGAEFKNILLQDTDTLKNPYRAYYAQFYQRIKKQSLASCDLYSLPVSIDKKSTTKEWLVSMDADCLEGQKTGHVWLIQRVNSKKQDQKQNRYDYHVLFEGNDNTLIVRYSTYNHYKNLAIKTRLRADEENDKRCGSMQAEWRYVAGRYLPYKAEANEHGDCLPEYNLPDYLQGENTFRLSEKEWQYGMEEEEKKRIALFEPYHQALEAYIPIWMQRMEQQVPAVGDAMEKMPLATTSTVADAGSGANKEEKGVMQSLWEFLGFAP